MPVTSPTCVHVLGHPVAHSLSPPLHGFWIDQYGVNGTYTLKDVAPEAMPAHFAALRAGESDGANVTLPLKEHALRLCDEVDDAAQTLGAVNTVWVRDDPEGRVICGTNTDHTGFAAAIDADRPGWADAAGSAIILGAGGAARAIAYALADRGIGPIHVLNRTPDKAETIVADLSGRGIAGLVAGGLDRFADLAPNAVLLVNTTSVGMHGTGFDNLDLGRLPANALVNDIVYTPLETPLLAAARARGLTAVDGLGMLLHQAVPGFARWFGVRPQVTAALRQHILAQLAVRDQEC